LYALLLSYIFFWIIYKIPRWRYIYLLIPLLLIAKYYIHTTDLGWDYYNNIWFTALPYFLIGIYLKDKDVTQTIHNSIIIATACMSFFAIIIFTITALSEPIPFLQIAITLWSISLFILALSHPNIYLKPFNVIGERYSLMIYILHPFIISIVEKIAKSLNLESNYYLWIAPIVVLIVALILAIVYEKIIDLTCNNRIRFLFLKK
jgi:peptidoglycan/LPS O-acetylase OafA/YrhL